MSQAKRQPKPADGLTHIRNMEEFAALSGLSRPTIAKYFHDPDSVRVSTREKIEAAIERYDYRPNMFAMNQNRKLTKNIGIVVPYLADPVFAEIARNLEQRCIRAGYRPTLYSAHGQQNLENDILDSLRSLKPAGVLLAPLGRGSDRAVIEKFCRDVPTIVVDRYLPDMGLAHVGSDNAQFTRLMVDYLCRTGEPPCFFEMQQPSNPNAYKRRQSYLESMERLGHAPCVVQVAGKGWSFEDIGQRGGLKALDEKQFSSNVILCSNDRLAIGLISACYMRGMRVGRDADIRIAGQDDHPFSQFTCPSLTTVAHDYTAVSRTATKLLFEAIEGGEKPYQAQMYEGKLVMRESA